jgi:hypothetical protein
MLLPLPWFVLFLDFRNLYWRTLLLISADASARGLATSSKAGDEAYV